MLCASDIPEQQRDFPESQMQFLNVEFMKEYSHHWSVINQVFWPVHSYWSHSDPATGLLVEESLKYNPSDELKQAEEWTHPAPIQQQTKTTDKDLTVRRGPQQVLSHLKETSRRSSRLVGSWYNCSVNSGPVPPELQTRYQESGTMMRLMFGSSLINEISNLNLHLVTFVKMWGYGTVRRSRNRWG